MKLENIDKVLLISIGFSELKDYLSALDEIITRFNNANDIPEEFTILKDFSLEITKILHSARDY